MNFKIIGLSLVVTSLISFPVLAQEDHLPSLSDTMERERMHDGQSLDAQAQYSAAYNANNSVSQTSILDMAISRGVGMFIFTFGSIYILKKLKLISKKL